MTEPMEQVRARAQELWPAEEARLHSAGDIAQAARESYVAGAEHYQRLVYQDSERTSHHHQGGEAAAYLARLQEQVDHLHLFHPEDGPMCRDALPAGALDMLQGAMELDQNYLAERIRAAQESAYNSGASDAGGDGTTANPYRRAEG